MSMADDKLDMILKYITKEIETIKMDSRYLADEALVQVNAPLALVQTELGGRLETLTEIKRKLIMSE